MHGRARESGDLRTSDASLLSAGQPLQSECRRRIAKLQNEVKRPVPLCPERRTGIVASSRGVMALIQSQSEARKSCQDPGDKSVVVVHPTIGTKHRKHSSDV